MGTVINGIEFTDTQVNQMAKSGLLNIGQKNDTPSTTPNAAPLQGYFPGNTSMFGALSYPGVRPERYSAMQSPRSFSKMLRPEKSIYQNELIEVITGQTAASGSNATGWCAGGMLPGVLKTCQQQYPFGNFKMRTRISTVQDAGILRNRADIPGILQNNPPQENPLVPDLLYRLTDTQSAMQTNFYELGNQIQRSMGPEIFNGVVGTDTSIPGWWKDMNSISALVKTGNVDAVSNLACPALDSIVVAWNADVAATVSGRNIVQAYTDTMYALQNRADTTGLGDVQFAFVMRKEAFYALTAVWACQYNTFRCQAGTAGQPNVSQVVDMNQMRIDMLRGNYLLIDGVPYPVLFDDGITIEQLGGGAAPVLRADAFILPVSRNGAPGVRLEYYDMGNSYSQEVDQLIVSQSMILNNGLYLMTKQFTEGCVDFTINAKMRLFIEWLFLAARIDDMSFVYQAQTRDANPATTFLHANGGISYRL
jgi:hypothetical protein